MSVTKVKHYFAIGSGAQFALGALHALHDSKLGAEAIARRAVEAAIAFDTYCGGEVQIHRVAGGAPAGAPGVDLRRRREYRTATTTNEEAAMFCSHDDRNRSVLVALVVGGLVGAGLALLLAPQSGKRTRQQIADLAEDLKDYATDLTDKVRTKVV